MGIMTSVLVTEQNGPVAKPPRSKAMKRTDASRFLGLVLMGFIAVGAAAQESYPSRTVRIVVPLAPGGGVDVLARVLAEKLSARWSQPVIVENRPGAALHIGAEAVAAANPDGYTLLFTPPGPLVTSQFLYSNLTFDPNAFVPVAIIAKVPFILVAGPKVNVTTLTELIGAGRAHPGKLSYPSPGVGSPPHLMGELLNARTGMRMVHVAYKGLVPALTDLVGGHIDVMFSDLGSALPHIQSGRLKALGVGSEARLPQLPDVPAISEVLADFVATTWFAVAAPPKTSAETAAKIARAVDETLRLPDVRGRLQDFSATPVGGTPAAAAIFLKSEIERWQQVIAAAAIKLQ
jgi:tripartite-type tricarboxylate transporter receptor subunit TctC